VSILRANIITRRNIIILEPEARAPYLQPPLNYINHENIGLQPGSMAISESVAKQLVHTQDFFRPEVWATLVSLLVCVVKRIVSLGG
jgi:hypothetical protein